MCVNGKEVPNPEAEIAGLEPEVPLSDDNDDDDDGPLESEEMAERVLNSICDKADTQPLLQLTEQQYLSGRAPRLGTANPEVMDIPFWSAMLAAQIDPYGMYCLLKGSGHFPHFQDIGDFLESTPSDHRPPTWTFANRMGRTMTTLPDDRVVFIAGEHEDSYDPDFHIYNDVCVYDGNSFVVYGYPEEIFPPTDFHSATLVTGTPDIYIIGSVGSPSLRQFGTTPVYRLDTRDFSMHRVETSGDEQPGWISCHGAEMSEDGTAIRVWGKKGVFQSQVYVAGEDERGNFVDFEGEYMLHLQTVKWTRKA